MLEKISVHELRFNQFNKYSQDKCFFLGPISSLVVDLSTTSESPWPDRKYFMA